MFVKKNSQILNHRSLSFQCSEFLVYIYFPRFCNHQYSFIACLFFYFKENRSMRCDYCGVFCLCHHNHAFRKVVTCYRRASSSSDSALVAAKTCYHLNSHLDIKSYWFKNDWIQNLVICVSCVSNLYVGVRVVVW